MKAPAKTWTPTKYPRLYRHSTGTYYARLVISGKPTWRSLGTEVLSVAKKELEEKEADAEQRAELGQGPAVSEEMDGAAAFAIREHQFRNNPAIKTSTKHYLEQIIVMLKRSWPDLEKTEIRKITAADCEKWAGKTSPKISGSRYNAALSMLRSLFEIAIERGVRRTNPAAKLKRSRVKLKDLSNRLPTRSQFQEWVEAIRTAGGRFSQHCADYVEFLAYTGMRIGEAKWVKWQHCDFTRGEILVTGNPEHGTKNHESRRVPMIGAVKSLLERLREDNPEAEPEENVLKVTMAKKAMNRATEETEMGHITHHDLRHFFATICIESGVDIPTVSRWLGHKDGGALAMKVYGHLRNEHSIAAAAKVSFAP